MKNELLKNFSNEELDTLQTIALDAMAANSSAVTRILIDEEFKDWEKQFTKDQVLDYYEHKRGIARKLFDTLEELLNR